VLKPSGFFMVTDNDLLNDLLDYSKKENCIYHSFYSLDDDDLKERERVQSDPSEQEANAVLYRGDTMAAGFMMAAWFLYLLGSLVFGSPPCQGFVIKQIPFPFNIVASVSSQLFISMPLELYFSALLGPGCLPLTGFDNIYQCPDLGIKEWVVFIPGGALLVSLISICVVAQMSREGIEEDQATSLGLCNAIIWLIVILLMGILAIVDMATTHYDSAMMSSEAFFSADFSYFDSEAPRSPKADLGGLEATLILKGILGIMCMCASLFPDSLCCENERDDPLLKVLE